MVDVFKVADMLVSNAIKTYGDDVDIIGYYGSYAQGVATDTSDLDIFYIPREGTNPPIARTFLVKDILFDFWAIRWDMMKGFATGKIRGWSFAPAIVHHAKLLHARSEQQSARFTNLKRQVLDLQKPEAQPQMVRRALDEFPKVMTHLGNLRLVAADSNLVDIRHTGWKIILSIWECLALVNQTFFDQGWRNILDQLPRLLYRPDDMECLIVIITTSSNQDQIVSACEQLALSTRQVLRRFQASLSSKTTIHEQFDQCYPEMKNGILKVISSCEQQRQVAASSAAWFLQYDIATMLNGIQNSGAHGDFNLYSEIASVYCQVGLPDLMQCGCGDLNELAKQAKLFNKRFREWLCEHSVTLNEFNNLEELKCSL